MVIRRLFSPLSRTAGRCARTAPWPAMLLSASLALAQAPVGDVLASDANVRGAVTLSGSGTRILSGSTISAGASPATLRLARGGSVRVCPGTNLAVAASPNGQALSLGFSTGAVELHYDLVTSADTLQTPDFRLLLSGPGSFHIAVSADAMGNACVRPLGHNTASVIVSELFGDGTYQVKPGEPVVFPKGRLAGVSHDPPPDCGCPAPEVVAVLVPPAAERASATAPVPAVVDRAMTGVDKLTADSQPRAATNGGLEAQAPLVYHADPAIPDPPQVALVQISQQAKILTLVPIALPPSQSETAAPKGVLGRIRAFFSALFK